MSFSTHLRIRDVCTFVVPSYAVIASLARSAITYRVIVSVAVCVRIEACTHIELQTSHNQFYATQWFDDQETHLS